MSLKNGSAPVPSRLFTSWTSTATSKCSRSPGPANTTPASRRNSRCCGPSRKRCARASWSHPTNCWTSATSSASRWSPPVRKPSHGFSAKKAGWISPTFSALATIYSAPSVTSTMPAGLPTATSSPRTWASGLQGKNKTSSACSISRSPKPPRKISP